MRIYLPSSMEGLRRLCQVGDIEASVAWAVTPALRTATDGLDDDELEFLAMSAAALGSAREYGERRVVVVADVQQSLAEDTGTQDGRVLVLGPIMRIDVAAVHVDAADQLVIRADDEDRDAGDLLWFANQEIEDLVQEAVR
jgi:hypothetical protein